jgi:hypothetical protein
MLNTSFVPCSCTRSNQHRHTHTRTHHCTRTPATSRRIRHPRRDGLSQRC